MASWLVLKQDPTLHHVSHRVHRSASLHIIPPTSCLVFVQSGPARGLIYSATADYRRDSIPTARDALTAQKQSINVQLDATDDNTRFTNAGLASYDVLIFLMNTDQGSADTASYLSSSPPEADHSSSFG